MKKVSIVTHNGGFHADDVFAAATILLVLEKEGSEYTITRTRDEALITDADVVFDVGGVHDEATNRFDHHQKGGAGMRENGIPYAACGLVWKKYGAVICDSEEIADAVDKILIQPVDAFDNGIDTYKTVMKDLWPLTINTIVGFYNTTEKEGEEDANFVSLVHFAKDILRRAIMTEKIQQELKRVVQTVYAEAKDKSLLVFETPQDRIALQIALQEYHDVLFAVYPHKKNGDWRIIALVDDINSFILRKPVPETWAGLRDEAFEKGSGVKGARFCHNGRFLVVADTKEAILQLAAIALSS